MKHRSNSNWNVQSMEYIVLSRRKLYSIDVLYEMRVVESLSLRWDHRQRFHSFSKDLYSQQVSVVFHRTRLVNRNNYTKKNIEMLLIHDEKTNVITREFYLSLDCRREKWAQKKGNWPDASTRTSFDFVLVKSSAIETDSLYGVSRWGN